MFSGAEITPYSKVRPCVVLPAVNILMRSGRRRELVEVVDDFFVPGEFVVLASIEPQNFFGCGWRSRRVRQRKGYRQPIADNAETQLATRSSTPVDKIQLRAGSPSPLPRRPSPHILTRKPSRYVRPSVSYNVAFAAGDSYANPPGPARRSPDPCW